MHGSLSLSDQIDLSHTNNKPTNPRRFGGFSVAIWKMDCMMFFFRGRCNRLLTYSDVNFRLPVVRIYIRAIIFKIACERPIIAGLMRPMPNISPSPLHHLYNRSPLCDEYGVFRSGNCERRNGLEIVILQCFSDVYTDHHFIVSGIALLIVKVTAIMARLL